MRITIKEALKIILADPAAGASGCFAAAAGTNHRMECGRRGGTGPPRRPSTAISAFVWPVLPGSYFPRSDFLFFGFLGRSKYKNGCAFDGKIRIALVVNQLAAAVHLAEPIAESW
jgi:hypothetical protein